MAVSADPTDPNFGLETDQSSPNFGLPSEPPKQESVVGNALAGAGDVIKGFAKQFVPDLSLKNLASIAYGPVNAQIQGYNALKGVVDTADQVREAENTAPFSRERFGAGFNVVGQLGLLALGAKAPKPLSEIAGFKPEVAPEVMPQTPEPLATEVASVETKLPDWAREEMQRRGLDPNRPLNDVDIQNPSVRDAVLNDPTLTEPQKQNILKTGAPNAVQEQSPSSVLPHPQEGITETGGERVGVGPSVQGEEIAQARPQTQEVAAEQQIGLIPTVEAIRLAKEKVGPEEFQRITDARIKNTGSSSPEGKSISVERSARRILSGDLGIEEQSIRPWVGTEPPPVPKAEGATTAAPEPKTGAAVPPEQPPFPQEVTSENWPDALAAVKSRYGGTKALTDSFNKWLESEGIKLKDPQDRAGQMQEFVRKIVEEPDDVSAFLPKEPSPVSRTTETTTAQPTGGISEKTKAQSDIVPSVLKGETTVYHSTPAQFEHFDARFENSLGTHFGTQEQAGYVKSNISEGGRTIQARIQLQNPLVLKQDLVFTDGPTLVRQLRNAGALTNEDIAILKPQLESVEKAQSTARFDDDPKLIKAQRAAMSGIKEVLVGKGYDGIVYPNYFERKGMQEPQMSYAVFDTSKIKQIKQPSPQTPEGGAGPPQVGRPETPSEPPPVTPETPVQPPEEVPTGGVHAEALAERPIAEIPPGEEVTWQEVRKFGQDFFDKGGNINKVMADFNRTGDLNLKKIGAGRIYLERLQAVTDRAQDALRGNPTDPVLQQNYGAAKAAEQRFAEDYKPMATAASNQLKGFKGKVTLTDDMADSFSALERKYGEIQGKPMSPEDVIKAEKLVKQNAKAKGDMGVANEELYKRIDTEYGRIRTPRKGPPTLEDLGRTFGQTLKEVCET